MIEKADLVHAGEILKVSLHISPLKCNLFADNPSLTSFPHSVRALVGVDDFREFVLVLEDKSVQITNADLGGLSLLCDQFCFIGLSEWLSAFQRSANFKAVVMIEEAEA
jgi:hypothetical protein